MTNRKLGEARFLYGLIMSLASKSGVCYASNDFLSKVMECDPRSIRTYISKLKEAKLIRVEYAENSSRLIYPLDTIVGQKIAEKPKKQHLKANEPEWLDEYIQDLANMK